MATDSKDQGKIKKWPSWSLFGALFVCTGLVIYVFYHTLFFNKDSISHPLNISCLKTAIFILFLVALSTPIVTMCWRWYCHLEKNENGESAKSSRWESDIVTYLIHFIPFFVLSLALLFQLENVVSGKTSSMTAIAGVMILYMLSSLGAGILHVVNEMKNKASELQENLGKADSAIQTIPIIKHFSKIIGSGEGPRLAKPIEDLTESWASIADKDREGIKGVVLRTLLYKYFKEENKDVTGGSDRSRVPKECWPYFDEENTTSHESKVAFLATIDPRK
jgi:hypothetical protein